MIYIEFVFKVVNRSLKIESRQNLGVAVNKVKPSRFILKASATNLGGVVLVIICVVLLGLI